MKNISKLLLFGCLILFGCTKKNELELNFSEPLEADNFKIEMEILEEKGSKAIIFDGKKKFEIINEYGENEWYINYKDSLFAYFRHFKSNRNDRHIYKFNFYKKDNLIFVKINIDGPSNENRVLQFSKDK